MTDSIPTQAAETIDVGRVHTSTDTEVDEAREELRPRIEGLLGPSVDRLMAQEWAREQGVSRAQVYAALERFFDGEVNALYLDAARYIADPTHPAARRPIGDLYVERFGAALEYVLRAPKGDAGE